MHMTKNSRAFQKLTPYKNEQNENFSVVSTANFDKSSKQVTESRSQFTNQYIDQELKSFQVQLNEEKHDLVMFDSEKLVYGSDSLMVKILQVEKILNYSADAKKYLNYRNYPDPNLKIKNQAMISFTKNKESGNKKDEHNFLELLFDFQFQDTEGQSVNQLNFNAVNSDLFVAGYGNFNQLSSKGLLALWTIKNQKYPECFIETSSPVLSAKFSKQHPNLLACGFLDGNLNIYDTRQKLSKPIVKSENMNDLKHLDAIWNVDWISKGQKGNKGESLVSISSDGKLYEWQLKKSLEVQELKIINQVNDQMKENVTKNINFRYSSGFCFDFN